MDTIRGKFLKQHLLSDEFLDLIEKNKRPMDELMSYYQCHHGGGDEIQGAESGVFPGI